MFGESSAIYPHAVIHICSCQQCCVEISFSTKLSEFEPAPGRKASFFPRQGTWIFERFLRYATYEFSAMRVKKKKGNAHCIFDYSLDRYSHRATSWRCVWCTPFGSRWTIVSAKGNGRWWRLTIIFIRDALSNPLYLLAFGSERMPRKHLDSLPSCLYRNNRVCFPSSLYRSNL